MDYEKLYQAERAVTKGLKIAGKPLEKYATYPSYIGKYCKNSREAAAVSVIGSLLESVPFGLTVAHFAKDVLRPDTIDGIFWFAIGYVAFVRGLQGLYYFYKSHKED